MTSPRIHIVTLGVDDLPRARCFYEALGWRTSSTSNDNIAFLTGGGTVLALYGRAALAEDAHCENDLTGFAAVTLARNAASKAQVDAWYAEALKAGARAVKPPQEVFWGGYSAYIADLDDHLWEFAFNPFFVFDEHGNLALPD